MDADTLSLGTEKATWAIKDFSVVLRQHITAAARRQDCTVADWLHGHFQKHGLDGQQFDPVQIDPGKPLQAPSQGPDICSLVNAVATFAECRDKLPPRLQAAVARRLKQEIEPVAGLIGSSSPRLTHEPTNG